MQVSLRLYFLKVQNKNLCNFYDEFEKKLALTFFGKLKGVLNADADLFLRKTF